MDTETIIIDPGHGGHDPGAMCEGVKEKNVNLRIAKLVDRKFYKLGYRSLLTRGTDDYISLRDRCEVADEARLFVSIHCNAAGNSNQIFTEPNGFEVWHHPTSEKGRSLAGKVVSRLSENLGDKMSNRGVRAKEFFVLRNTIPPAALVECGFLTNDNDRAILSDYSGQSQERIAQAIVDGIIDFIGG